MYTGTLREQMLPLSSRATLLFVLGALLSVNVACGDDDPLTSDPLTDSTIPGTYHGIEFIITDSEGATLILWEEDGEIDVVLEEGGAISGSLIVPGMGIDETLSGSWTFDDVGDIVTLMFDESQLLPSRIDMEASRIPDQSVYVIHLAGGVVEGDSTLDLILASESRTGGF